MNPIFTHPVIAEGMPRGQPMTRTVIGTVDTPVEIADYASSDVETAFTFPFGGDPVIRVDDRLFMRQDIASFGQGAVDIKPDWDGGRTNPDGFAFYSIVERLFDRLASKGVRDSVFPAIRSKGDLLERTAFDQAKRAGPIAKRGLGLVSDDEVEAWRGHARDFFSEIVLVDGLAHMRCHEPVVAVSGSGTYRYTASIFRKHVGEGRRDTFGLPERGSGAATGRIHVFPADMAAEAEELLSELQGWHRSGVNHGERLPVVAHVEAMSIRDMLDSETRRLALNLVTGLRWQSVERQKDAVRALRGFEAGLASMAEVTAAFDALVDEGRKEAAATGRTTEALVTAEWHMKRLDLAPIPVAAFSGGIPSGDRKEP